jgi:hypothetical protein
MADPTQQLFDMWKKQVEEGSQAWLRMLGTPQAQPLDPQAFWRPFMDQGIAAWSKVMTQGQASPDLMAQWKQFLDQWIAAWSRVLEQAMGTEAFAKTLGKQIEGSLAGLGLPSRSQVVSLAKQIVLLEEKIEGLEDKLALVLKRLESR